MTRKAFIYKHDVSGWRRRSMVAALGLRPPRADHTPEEGTPIEHAVAGAGLVVEVGALEGGASTAIRRSMRRGGTLVVVDPYYLGRFGFSAARVAARRAARRQPFVETRWIRATSLEAAARWQDEIDACIIDAIHTPEGVRDDWTAWGRFVRPGGVLVARNDVVPEPTMPGELRSAALLALAAPDPEDWEILGAGGTFTAYRRRSPSP